MNCLEEIIKEAKCCASNMASEYVEKTIFGNEDVVFNTKLFGLNSLIRTLDRNKTRHKEVKQTVLEYPKKVSLSSLMSNKKTLFLKPKPEEKIICKKIKLKNCLSDSEIKEIVEKIKLLCSNCNCNCN